MPTPQQKRLLFGVKAPVITGNAYPWESLFSTRSGQWYVNGVPAGVSTSYLVGPRDIGLPIYQVAGGLQSNTFNCWSPLSEPTVTSFRVGNSRAYTSILPNVDAADNQVIRQWGDGSPNAYTADQTTGANQPLSQRAEINGQDVVQFNGANQFLDVAGVAGMYRNKAAGGVILGLRDTNRAGGAAAHFACHHSGGASVGAARLTLLTRSGSTSVFAMQSRRLDGDALVSITAPSSDGWHCLHAQALWSAGVANLRLNGEQVAAGNFASSGNTSDTDALRVQIGGNGSGSLPGDIGVEINYVGVPTANSTARLERYTMGYIGKLAQAPAYTSAS